MSTNNTLEIRGGNVGGGIQVFTQAINVTMTGAKVALADLPTAGNSLLAGTPVLSDSYNHTATVHYAFEVVNVAGAVLQLKKRQGSTTAKVGMFLMESTADLATTGTAATILSIDTSNEAYDIVTLSAALTGLAVGDTVYEANQDGAGAVVKVIPNAITAYETLVNSNTVHATVAIGFNGDGEIFERRISPITPAIRVALKANDCFFRYTQSR